LVSIPLSSAGDTFVALVPERERWRTFHQFAVLWFALSVTWTVVMGASGWLPVGTAVSAISARVVAAWRQHRRDRRGPRVAA
jgi:hypothetical protein